MLQNFFIESIPTNPGMVISINTKLVELGLLDPAFQCTIEKRAGPISTKYSNSFLSKWTLDSQVALSKWYDLYLGINIDKIELLHVEHYSALMDSKVPDLKPINQHPSNILAFRIAQRMIKEGYFINKGLGINTCYFEGVNGNGTPNDDAPDKWNDLCIWFVVAIDGSVSYIGQDTCTTEPGRFYTFNPLNKSGAARIAFGQYKAWIPGLHKGFQPALVQNGPIKIHRDSNKSMTRSKNDPIEVVTAAGINQHTKSFNDKNKSIGKNSAGCLVKENYDIHLKWVDLSKNDYRTLGNLGYVHIAAVIAGPII